jgi:hypothetical protein
MTNANTPEAGDRITLHKVRGVVTGTPGTVVEVIGDWLRVRCDDGAYLTVQSRYTKPWANGLEAL